MSDAETRELGLRHLGHSVRISRHALFLAPELTSIGDYSRIDAYCVLSAGGAGLSIGRNVHLSAFVSVLGQEAVEIGDFATLSVRCSIFSSNDDYSGTTMANPTVPAEIRGAVSAPVRIGPHAIMGVGTTVLPGATIGESVSVGAGSLIKEDVPAFAMVAGVPARFIRSRRREHRALAEAWLAEEAAGKREKP